MTVNNYSDDGDMAAAISRLHKAASRAGFALTAELLDAAAAAARVELDLRVKLREKGDEGEYRETSAGDGHASGNPGRPQTA